jgi:hypothetical protein
LDSLSSGAWLLLWCRMFRRPFHLFGVLVNACLLVCRLGPFLPLARGSMVCACARVCVCLRVLACVRAVACWGVCVID